MTEPIDFKELDPTRREGFEALVQRMAARGVERGVQPTLSGQIAALWRFALLGATGAAVACWALASPTPSMRPSTRDALLVWAAHDDATSRAMLLASLEVPDER